MCHEYKYYGGKYKMKKTVALLFALVMAFSVCACSQPAPAEETTEETAETAAPAEETSAEKPHFCLLYTSRCV